MKRLLSPAQRQRIEGSIIKPQLVIASLRLYASELSICLFICMSPKCKKRDFFKKVCNLKLWCL